MLLSYSDQFILKLFFYFVFVCLSSNRTRLILVRNQLADHQREEAQNDANEHWQGSSTRIAAPAAATSTAVSSSLSPLPLSSPSQSQPHAVASSSSSMLKRFANASISYFNTYIPATAVQFHPKASLTAKKSSNIDKYNYNMLLATDESELGGPTTHRNSSSHRIMVSASGESGLNNFHDDDDDDDDNDDNFDEDVDDNRDQFALHNRQHHHYSDKDNIKHRIQQTDGGGGGVGGGDEYEDENETREIGSGIASNAFKFIKNNTIKFTKLSTSNDVDYSNSSNMSSQSAIKWQTKNQQQQQQQQRSILASNQSLKNRYVGGNSGSGTAAPAIAKRLVELSNNTKRNISWDERLFAGESFLLEQSEASNADDKHMASTSLIS